jgi:hypothetical protein
MDPIELELMIFINEHFLSPSIYDGIMKWARKAYTSNYTFESPCHRTLKKRLDVSFPPALHGGVVQRQVFDTEDIGSDTSIELCYFEPVPLIAAALRNPSLMEHFIFHPQMKKTVCGKRVYDEATSAEWFHKAFHNSPATENGVLKQGHLFIGLCDFDDGSVIDKMMKSSEHPFLMSMMNLTQQKRQSADAWLLLALLPDIEVSDLEKSKRNQKANGDLALKRLQLYHKCSAFLHSSFQDPNKHYDLWVHGMGMTKVYFQLGMIVGDTEQHNKICGFRGGNGKFRKFASRDCDCPTHCCDDPNYVCNRSKIDPTRKWMNWVFDPIKHPNPKKMRCIPPQYDVRQSSESHATRDEWCRSLSRSPIIPSLFSHNFGGDEEGVLGACPFELLHQFQLGLLKYIVMSLYNYRSLPPSFNAWLSTRSNPKVFDDATSNKDATNKSSSDDESLMGEDPDTLAEEDDNLQGEEADEGEDVDEEEETGDYYSGNGKTGKKRDADSQSIDSNEEVDNKVDLRSESQKFKHWLKSRPKSKKKAGRNVFSRVFFEKAARHVNGYLERQSDRSIPSLSYRSGLTAVTKMSGQEFPGLCLLTIFSMGGMMGPGMHDLEADFTTLLWLSISMNDLLSQKVYTSACLDVLHERIVRYLSVTKALIGDQREYLSAIGLRLAKFHGMLHYTDYILKFGSPLNFYGGFLESFLKDKLKRPSKRVNGHSHRLQYDILTRSQDARQFVLARQVLFTPKYVTTLLDPVLTLSEDNIESPPKSTVRLPRHIHFSSILNAEGEWIIVGHTKKDAPPPPTRDQNIFSRLFHPDLDSDKFSVANIVQSAVLRASESGNATPLRVDFFYHVTVPSESGETVIMRCNPIWNELVSPCGESPVNVGRMWFDWVEVNWVDGNGEHYTVPAQLRLFGNVLHSDGSNELLASIRSLRSETHLPHHNRMFFGRVDSFHADPRTSFNVVEFHDILSTAFVVPAIPPLPTEKPTKKQNPKKITPAMSLEQLVVSNSYCSLPPRCDWKNIGWDRKLSFE